MSDETYLLALALVEACLLDDGTAIRDIAQAVRRDEETEQVLQALALILTSTLMEGKGSLGGAIECVYEWRLSVLANEHRDKAC